MLGRQPLAKVPRTFSPQKQPPASIAVLIMMPFYHPLTPFRSLERGTGAVHLVDILFRQKPPKISGKVVNQSPRLIYPQKHPPASVAVFCIILI